MGENHADMLLVPCQHLRLCSFCLARAGARGCPTCGTQIKYKCSIQWPEDVKDVKLSCDWYPPKEIGAFSDDTETCIPPMFQEETELMFMRRKFGKETKHYSAR